MESTRMNVLVIGGSGVVGTLIVPILAESHELRLFDLRPPQNGAYDYFQGDVTDYDALAQAASGMDALIYMAMGSLNWGETVGVVSALDVNVKGVYLALKAAHEAGVNQAVYTSTMSVYGGDLLRRYFSDEAVTPDSAELYGFTKRLGEEVCLNADPAMGHERQRASALLSESSGNMAAGNCSGNADDCHQRAGCHPRASGGVGVCGGFSGVHDQRRLREQNHEYVESEAAARLGAAGASNPGASRYGIGGQNVAFNVKQRGKLTYYYEGDDPVLSSLVVETQPDGDLRICFSGLTGGYSATGRAWAGQRCLYGPGRRDSARFQMLGKLVAESRNLRLDCRCGFHRNPRLWLPAEIPESRCSTRRATSKRWSACVRPIPEPIGAFSSSIARRTGFRRASPCMWSMCPIKPHPTSFMARRCIRSR